VRHDGQRINRLHVIDAHQGAARIPDLDFGRAMSPNRPPVVTISMEMSVVLQVVRSTFNPTSAVAEKPPLTSVHNSNDHGAKPRFSCSGTPMESTYEKDLSRCSFELRRRICRHITKWKNIICHCSYTPRSSHTIPTCAELSELISRSIRPHRRTDAKLVAITEAAAFPPARHARSML
jgi:hypothetical protein